MNGRFRAVDTGGLDPSAAGILGAMRAQTVGQDLSFRRAWRSGHDEPKRPLDAARFFDWRSYSEYSGGTRSSAVKPASAAELTNCSGVSFWGTKHHQPMD